MGGAKGLKKSACKRENDFMTDHGVDRRRDKDTRNVIQELKKRRAFLISCIPSDPDYYEDLIADTDKAISDFINRSSRR